MQEEVIIYDLIDEMAVVWISLYAGQLCNLETLLFYCFYSLKDTLSIIPRTPQSNATAPNPFSFGK